MLRPKSVGDLKPHAAEIITRICYEAWMRHQRDKARNSQSVEEEIPLAAVKLQRTMDDGSGRDVGAGL